MGKILVLEDNRDVADAIADLLAAHHWQVRITPSGREAVVLAAREDFALALLDVDVEELSGLGAERAIADFERMPVVVCSAARGRWQEEAFRGGAAACARKPDDISRLPQVVRALVGAPLEPRPIAIEQLDPVDLASLAQLDAHDVASLPYGVIELDRDGVVTGFSAYEAAAADRDVADVVGRHFSDVAPCTRVKRFTDLVAEAFRARKLDRVVRFVFPCFGASSIVTVRLFYDDARDRLWLFVSRRAPAERNHAVARKRPDDPMATR